MLSSPFLTGHLFKTFFISLAIFIFQANPFTLKAAQNGQADSSTIVSPALNLSEPVFFDLAKGETLKIVPQGPAGFSFDIFVYDTSTHDLVGRSDDDSTEPYF